MEEKKYSYFTKFIAYLLVLILFSTPLYELIPGLDPEGFNEYFYHMCCMPFSCTFH